MGSTKIVVSAGPANMLAECSTHELGRDFFTVYHAPTTGKAEFFSFLFEI